jgi:cytochrome c-type biogenesis protein CcmH/NrfF
MSTLGAVLLWGFLVLALVYGVVLIVLGLRR